MRRPRFSFGSPPSRGSLLHVQDRDVGPGEYNVPMSGFARQTLTHSRSSPGWTFAALKRMDKAAMLAPRAPATPPPANKYSSERALGRQVNGEPSSAAAGLVAQGLATLAGCTSHRGGLTRGAVHLLSVEPLSVSQCEQSGVQSGRRQHNHKSSRVCGCGRRPRIGFGVDFGSGLGLGACFACTPHATGPCR